jgi:hypothetical protein
MEKSVADMRVGRRICGEVLRVERVSLRGVRSREWVVGVVSGEVE